MFSHKTKTKSKQIKTKYSKKRKMTIKNKTTYTGIPNFRQAAGLSKIYRCSAPEQVPELLAAAATTTQQDENQNLTTTTISCSIGRLGTISVI